MSEKRVVVKSRKTIASEAARNAGIRLYWRSSYPRWNWDKDEIARTANTKYFSLAAILRDCDYSNPTIEAINERIARIGWAMDQITHGRYCCPDWCAGSGQCAYCRLHVEMDEAERELQAAYENVGKLPLG